MKKIYSNIIPFSGYKAMALFPFIFIRKEHRDKITKETINHEAIHFEQQKELGLIFFLILYIIQWFFKSIMYGSKEGYKKNCFEAEAFANMNNLKYLEKRKRYSFFKYLI